MTDRRKRMPFSRERSPPGAANETRRLSGVSKEPGAITSSASSPAGAIRRTWKIGSRRDDARTHWDFPQVLFGRYRKYLQLVWERLFDEPKEPANVLEAAETLEKLAAVAVVRTPALSK